MLGQGGLKVITVMSAQRKSGRSAAVANLAAAITRSGREVLVLDQDSNGRGVCSMLGVVPRGTLFDVVAQRQSLDDIILATADGVHVLPIGGGFEEFARLSRNQQKILENSLARLKRKADVILIDTRDGFDPSRLPIDLASSEILVLMSASSESITGSYGMVKKLAQDLGKQRFRLLLNRVGNPEEASVIAGNFAQTAGEYLGVEVDFVGHIPFDERLVRAGVLHKSVVDAFPVAESTIQFRRLADGLLRWPSSKGLGEVGDFILRLVQGSRLLGACKRV